MKGFVMLLSTAAIALSPHAHAHSNAQSFEKQLENYFIDIGYSQSFVVNEKTVLDISLYDQQGDMPQYSSVLISVESGSSIQYRSKIDKPDLGKPFMSLVLKSEGNWSLRTTFLKDEAVIAEAVFPVFIQQNASQSRNLYFVYGVLLLFLSLLITTYRRLTV